MNEPAIVADRLTVRYAERDALRSVNFAVPECAFVAIIGPNGAGKTTLLHAAMGLLEADSGSIRVFGHAPNALAATDMGYVPQRKTLDRRFPATVLELVVTGLRGAWPWRIRPAERDAAFNALDQCRVGGLANRPLTALSGGELQRVYLARIVARQPRLIMLDEPAAGIDKAGEADMYHILAEHQASHRVTIMMITHDWEGARTHASHVLLLDQGLAAFGPPEEVAREDRLLRVFGHTGHRAATHRDDDRA